MANLNEAFSTWKEPSNNNYMNKLLNKIPKYDDENKISPNSVGNKFMHLSDTENRVKVSNEKYDKIIRGDRTMYGYICADCNGCVGYHTSIQDNDPHEFIRGEYRKLLSYENGPFINGKPLIN